MAVLHLDCRYRAAGDAAAAAAARRAVQLRLPEAARNGAKNNRAVRAALLAASALHGLQGKAARRHRGHNVPRAVVARQKKAFRAGPGAGVAESAFAVAKVGDGIAAVAALQNAAGTCLYAAAAARAGLRKLTLLRAPRRANGLNGAAPGAGQQTATDNINRPRWLTGRRHISTLFMRI